MARDFNQNRITNAKLGRETLNKFGANYAVAYGLDGFNIVDIQTSEAPSNIVEYFEGNDTYEIFGLPNNITKLCAYALASFPSISDLYLFTDSVIEIEDDLSYLTNLTAIYVSQDLLSSYQTQYANVPNILNKLGTVPVDYELTIPVFDNIGNVLNEQAINYFLNGLSQAQKEQCSKLIISNDYFDYYSGVWHFNFSEVFENLNNNIYYGNTQIGFTNYIIQGSGELTAGIVETQYNNISVDKLDNITKVTVPDSFTSYSSGSISKIEQLFSNISILTTTYYAGEMDIEIGGDIEQKIISIGKTLDEALVYAKTFSQTFSDNNVIDNNDIIIVPPLPSNKRVKFTGYESTSSFRGTNLIYCDKVYGISSGGGCWISTTYKIKEIVFESSQQHIYTIYMRDNKCLELVCSFPNGTDESYTATQIDFRYRTVGVSRFRLNNFTNSFTILSGGSSKYPSVLTRENLVELFNSLGTPINQQTITLPAVDRNKLTADDIAIATAKNWVVQ